MTTVSKQGELQRRVTQNMRLALAAKDVKQVALSECLGISGSALSQKLRGKSPWTIDDIEKAGEFLRISPASFLMVAGHGFEPWTSGL